MMDQHAVYIFLPDIISYLYKIILLYYYDYEVRISVLETNS